MQDSQPSVACPPSNPVLEFYRIEPEPRRVHARMEQDCFVRGCGAIGRGLSKGQAGLSTGTQGGKSPGLRRGVRFLSEGVEAGTRERRVSDQVQPGAV